MPDYYSNYCVCVEPPISIWMANLQGVQTTSYPVDVFNVNEILIGTADTKEEYITIWNSDPANQAIGTLSAGLGPFTFKLVLNTGQTAPDYVIGVPLQGRQQLGIYEIAYEETEYE